MQRSIVCLLGAALVAVGSLALSPGRPGLAADGVERGKPLAPVDAARMIDAVLADELASESGGSSPAQTVDDESYLRRVSQDLVGELPNPAEITAFVLDPAADKRAKIVARLLADPRYGENWAHYFRDVILYRRTDERALLAGQSITEFLSKQLNSGAGWDQIARSFITAKGDVRENGSTGLFMAQMGQAPEIAAETARIFLGIQIQCAQCHDHKTDRWKRRQFHELAAFFPRVAIRPVRDGERRSFEVVSRDATPKKPPKNGKPRGTAEYYMPDLDDPSAKGTLTTPAFFLTGQKLPEGTKDADRRKALADWITDKSNPWFARALVNRLWAELVGHGFYDPLDDMGPDRTAIAPRTLDLLASKFVEHGYDLRWLLGTIMATERYQRHSRSPADGTAAHFAANCPQALRADQVFASLTSALAIDERQLVPPGPPGPQKMRRGPRAEFDRTFGYDPSDPRDEITASIPQALLMMNAPLLARAINGRNAGTVLGKLLAAESDDETVVTELYLRCLAREPRPEELAACLSYARSTADRAEAFEDLLWALVNTTEFTHRK